MAATLFAVALSAWSAVETTGLRPNAGRGNSNDCLFDCDDPTPAYHLTVIGWSKTCADFAFRPQQAVARAVATGGLKREGRTDSMRINNLAVGTANAKSVLWRWDLDSLWAIAFFNL